MFTFLISFILIFVSSYFLSSILAKGNGLNGFIYTLLIAFSQIILTSEIVSIFYKVHERPFLCLNILFFIVSTILWYIFKRPLFKFELGDFFKRFINACKLDKSLFVLFIGWLFFIFVSILLIIILPTTSGDGYCYHVVRSYDWVINQSLAHYETADIRCLTFPINSEILYMWVLLFTKKQLCLGSFTFVGYLLFILCSCSIFKYLGFSLRRTLWTLFIISSFASVVVMVSGTETDLIIAGLITASVYLFMYALKYKSNNVAIFMSSLAYALAIGVKTPAIICIPAIGLLFVIFSYKFKNKFALLKFILFGILNFLLFSSYNYILNFINYGNIMGTLGSIYAHKNFFGLIGAIGCFIKHLFLLVDFSGFRVPSNISDFLYNFEILLLKKINVNNVEGLYSGKYYFNTSLIEPGMGCGILSFLLILPCWFISLIAPLFIKKRRIKIYGLYALLFLINLFLLSYLVVFMTFNTRFITSFILISAPMLACSYIKSNKNVIKILFVIIAMFYFVVISTHLWGRPFVRLIKALKHESIVELRSDIICGRYDKRKKALEEWCNINGLLESKFANKDYKVLIMPNFSEYILYNKVKKIKGYNYDFYNIEHLKNKDVDKYDIIILPINGQAVTSFDEFNLEKIDYRLEIIQKKPLQILFYPLDENSECLCYYNSLFGTISKEVGNTNEVPVKKVCKLTNKFFENHPFDFVFRTNKYNILLNTKRFPDYKTKFLY